jgi:hypothetical protein
VITAGGGNVITAGGGNVITAGGGNYRVAETPEIAPGTLLPVEGIAVLPVSLVTGRVLTSGVKTDGTGAYSLIVPASEKGNVRLLVAVPGKSADDPVLQNPRLSFTMLADSARASEHQDFDEIAAATTKGLRKSLLSRLRAILFAESMDSVQSIFDQWGAPDFFKAELFKQFGDLNQAIKDNKRQHPEAVWSEDDERFLSQQVLDIIYANVKLEDIALHPLTGYKGKNTKVIAGMRLAMSRMFPAAAAHLADAKQRFAAKQAPLDERDHTSLTAIEKPSDLLDYMIDQFLSQNRSDAFDKIDALNRDVLQVHDPDEGTFGDYLNMASVSLVFTVYETLRDDRKFTADQELGAKTQILTTIAAFKPGKQDKDVVRLQ